MAVPVDAQAVTGYSVGATGYGYAYYQAPQAKATKPTGPPPVTGSAVLAQSITLDIDSGALVRAVTVDVTAEAAGEVLVGDVATVRSAGDDPDAKSKVIIVDFNGLRTVSSIVDAGPTKATTDFESDLKSVRIWVGSAFADPASGTPISNFSETLTERLELTYASDQEPKDVERDIRVRLPAPPQSVEVRVNGGRVWSGLIGAQGEGPGAQTITADVDVTASVAAAAQAGNVPVLIELTSPTPADLTLSLTEEDILSRYQVGFPEGAVRKVRPNAEGRIQLDLPLDGLQDVVPIDIRRLELTVNATVPPTRVVPSEGPAVSADADVELTVDRAVVVRFPHEMLGDFVELNAVRVGVRVTEDCEIGGTLMAASVTEPTQPGDPLADVVLGPVVVSPLPTSPESMQWVTLELSEPIELDGLDRWVSLTVARGKAVFSLAPVSSATDQTDVLWRAPSGFYRSLSVPSEVPPLVGVVRAVGTPDEQSPVGSVQLSLRDRPSAMVPADPPSTGQRMVLDLGDEPLAATAAQLGVDLLVTTPGDFTLEQVDVFYSPKGSSE